MPMFICRQVTVLFIVFSVVACTDTARLEKLPANAVILAFGNSLTYGTGVETRYSYPRVLQELTGRPVINAGVPGEVTAEGLQRLPVVLAEYDPQLVILCHGGNDILRRHNLAQTKENLRAMIQTARDFGAQVVLVAVPQLALFPSAAGFYEDLAEELDVPLERDIIADLQTQVRYKADSIHFNREGYALMAQAVAEVLQQSGAL